MADLNRRTILFSEFLENVRNTNILPPTSPTPIAYGLFAEVGSVIAAAKKLIRERQYPEYRQAAEEEFGDSLWYFGALCNFYDVTFDEVFQAFLEQDGIVHSLAASDAGAGAIARVSQMAISEDHDRALQDLGRHASSLFDLTEDRTANIKTMQDFAASYVRALRAADVNFADVARGNMAKSSGAFLEPDWTKLDTFDAGFEGEERIPDEFRVTISVRRSGLSYLSIEGVFVGDPLSDAISDADGYRFHDVFHLANAAILHWSPVFRALIKQKRKSHPDYDTPQDGGRAIVIEEGLTAWIFSRAKRQNFFEGVDRIPYDILKTVQQFVAGYEVERVPLYLWDVAIRKGYSVFRQVLKANGGTVIGNRRNRTLEVRLD